MIRQEDLLEAIAECQGQKNPNANTCIKLAAYYTILEHLDTEENDNNKESERFFLRSYAPPQDAQPDPAVVMYDGDSDFANAIYDLPQQDVWLIIDDMMSAVRTLHPKLYESVMRKLDGLH